MPSSVSRFVRTPKGLMLVALVALLAIAAGGAGPTLVMPGVIAASVAAMMIDAPTLRLREGEWLIPDGALLTGLFVAMILSPHEHWYIAAITAAIGVASKYLLRVRGANVFNPAAFALVATFYLFHTGQSWWGALPEQPLPVIAMLFVTGIFIADRVNKVPAVLAFLGSYFALVTMAAYLGDPAKVAVLYRTPDLHAALFFAFFMVTDPPTSPPKQRDQIVFGVIAGVTSFAFYELVGAAYFLLAGLLVANAWEARRKVRTAGLRKAELRKAELRTNRPLPMSGDDWGSLRL